MIHNYFLLPKRALVVKRLKELTCIDKHSLIAYIMYILQNLYSLQDIMQHSGDAHEGIVKREVGQFDAGTEESSQIHFQ